MTNTETGMTTTVTGYVVDAVHANLVLVRKTTGETTHTVSRDTGAESWQVLRFPGRELVSRHRGRKALDAALASAQLDAAKASA